MGSQALTPEGKKIPIKEEGDWIPSIGRNEKKGQVKCEEISEIILDLKGGDDIAVELPACDTTNKETWGGVHAIDGSKIMRSVEPKKFITADLGRGDDKILTGRGKGHTVKGIGGNDNIIMQGKGSNHVAGGDNDDTIFGSYYSKSENSICGGKDKDTITARGGTNKIRGADGTDTITIMKGKGKGQGDEPKEEDGMKKDEMICDEDSSDIKCDPDTLEEPIIFVDPDLAADCPKNQESDNPTPPPEPPISH